MSKKKNIYNIDNRLKVIGILFMIVGIIAIFSTPSTYFDYLIYEDGHMWYYNLNGKTFEEARLGLNPNQYIAPVGWPLIRASVVLLGLVFFIVSRVFRSKEKRIINVWEAIEQQKEYKVGELAKSLSLTRAFILESLDEINAQHGAHFFHDAKSDKIIDGKAYQEIEIASDCTGCGVHINVTTTLSATKLPECPYCGTSVPVEKVKQVKTQVNDEASAQSGKAGVGFFITLLMIVVPPLGIVLALLKKKNAVQDYSKHYLSQMEKMKEIMEQHKTSKV